MLGSRIEISKTSKAMFVSQLKHFPLIKNSEIPRMLLGLNYNDI